MFGQVFKEWSLAVLLLVLFFSCEKPKTECIGKGTEYFHSSALWRYSPEVDSVPIGGTITFEAAVPKTFRDELSQQIVTNASDFVAGSIGAAMIYPEYKACIDSFELSADIGKIYKDTTNLTTGQLLGVRALLWNGNSSDSFRVKLIIKPLARGVYCISIGKQSAIDKNCALYRYNLKPGNRNQNLNYWASYLSPPSISVHESTFCLKVY